MKLIPDAALNSHAKRIAVVRQRAAAMWPAARKVGELIAREARRRAPRGRSRRQVSLQASLGHVEPEHNVTVLTSKVPYARIQVFGGTIVAGGGKLAAKMLAIPLNDTARRMLDSLGAGQSLRRLNLQLIESRSGRLFLARTVEAGTRGRKRGRSARGSKREHRMGNLQLLFLLRFGVRMPKHPSDFVPKLSDPAIRSMVAEVIRRWISEGRA